MIKETYTDEHLEIVRDSCKEIRDLAIIGLLNVYLIKPYSKLKISSVEKRGVVNIITNNITIDSDKDIYYRKY